MLRGALRSSRPQGSTYGPKWKRQCGRTSAWTGKQPAPTLDGAGELSGADHHHDDQGEQGDEQQEEQRDDHEDDEDDDHHRHHDDEHHYDHEEDEEREALASTCPGVA